MVYAKPHLQHPILFIPINFSKRICSALTNATYKHPSCIYITANYWFKHTSPRIKIILELKHHLLLHKTNILPIQANTLSRGLDNHSNNSSSLCGIKFSCPLPFLQLIPDYYKDNMIATMKKSKVQSAEELKLTWETENLVVDCYVRNLSMQSLYTKKKNQEKNYWCIWRELGENKVIMNAKLIQG